MKPHVEANSDTIIIRVSMRFKRRAGRKEIVSADGLDGTVSAAPQEALSVAVARAFRWRELMESGKFPSMSAMAEYLGYDRRYVGRALELTLLAPDIVEAILTGREPSGLSLEKLNASSIPVMWRVQRKEWGFKAPVS